MKSGFPNLVRSKPKPDVSIDSISQKPTVAEVTPFDSIPDEPEAVERKENTQPISPVVAPEGIPAADLEAPAHSTTDMAQTDEVEGEKEGLPLDLTEADKREIYDAIDLIRRKLSFAKDFTEAERVNLMRLGKTGRTFVEKAQGLVDREPGILPRSFDVDEFNRDAELYQELGNISDELVKLSERVADTEAAVGSDAFTASLVVYQSGKLARTGDDMDNHLACWRRKRNDTSFD